MALKRGQVIKTAFDTFVVLRQRGSGGTGVVYEIEDTERNLFAAKIIDPAKTDASRLKRFKNEISFCSTRTHKNIVKVLGTGLTESGAVFYVMPLYTQTLRDLITNRIEPNEVLFLFNQILDGVEAAHLSNVWHRDLKPENILYSSVDRNIVVADFGIAHFDEADLLTAVETRPGERLANFLYAAPEQKLRGIQVDQKADVYALGLMLHEMFLLQPPLGTGHAKVADIAPDFAFLDPLIDLMRSQDPARRPSIAEVKQELIARGNRFVELQRLDRMKNEVVSETEISDPIVLDPIRVIRKEDYRNGTLTLKLNQAVNRKWTECFYARATEFGNVSAANIRFANDSALLSADDYWIQKVVDYLNRYLPSANEEYAAQVRSDHIEALNSRNLALRVKVAQEETRQRILEKITI